MGFLKSKKFLILTGMLAFASFVDLYIITTPLMGIVQIVLWIAMAVVAYRFNPESSVVKKLGRVALAIVVAIVIGTVFFEMSQVVGG